MSEATFHKLDLEAVLARLRSYVDTQLAPRPEVCRVVLIGSLARGDWSARSDADLVVIVDEAGEPGPFRGSRYLPSTPVGVDVDVLVYTEEEARDWSARFRGDVEAGILLYPS